MKKVLVTGGNGYIGSYLTEILPSFGYSALITSRRGGSKNIRAMDLLKPETIDGVCAGADAVIHTANLDERLISENGEEALLANSFATRQLYLDAVRHGVSRFIYLSTFHVYGVSGGHIDENTPCRPKNDYGLTHLFAEQYLEQLSRKNSTAVDVIRLTNGIGVPPKGCDKWYLIVNDCCRAAAESRRIELRSSGMQKRDFVAIRDICASVKVLLSHEAREGFNLFNVSSQDSISMRGIAKLTAEAYKSMTGLEVELAIPDRQRDETADELFVSSEKIRALGWVPRLKVQEVIKDILASLL